MGVVPRTSAEDGRVAGLSAIWQDTSFAKSNLRHFRLWATGRFAGPDAPHEKTHRKVSACVQRGFGVVGDCRGQLQPARAGPLHETKIYFDRSLP